MRSFTAILLAALPSVLALPTIVARNVTTAASVPNSWIVELEDNAILSVVLSTVQTLTGIEPRSTFSVGKFRGFSFEGDDSAVALLSTLGALKRIEPDFVVEASAPASELQQRALVQQSSSTWGLSRISSRSRGTSGYVYDNTAGQNTFVYVIDTGVNSNHNDFGGRAIQGANFISGESIADGNGHGTHCSGTVGGTVYGVVSGISSLNFSKPFTNTFVGQTHNDHRRESLVQCWSRYQFFDARRA